MTENPHINDLSLLFVVKFNLNVSRLRELRALTLKSVENSLSQRATNARVSKSPVCSVQCLNHVCLPTCLHRNLTLGRKELLHSKMKKAQRLSKLFA